MGAVNNEHIKDRVQEIMAIIRDRPDYLSDKQAIETLTKAVKGGNQLKRECSDEATKSNVASNALIFDYAQFLLHFTFAIELKLVAVEFVEEQRQHVSTVCSYLDEIVALIQPLRDAPLSDIDNSILKELLECTYWRKGALLYMLCHTLYSEPSRYLDNIPKREKFISHCKKGIIALTQDMRGVRQKDSQLEYAANDSQLIALVKEGIFGDTNMLAIMYSAEMCYWIDLTKEKYDIDLDIGFDACTLGGQLADQYIRIAEGPLKESKWNTSQARAISQHCKH